MTETPSQEPKPTNKNILQKLQEKIPDRDEQFEYVGLGVRLLLLIWATLMLSLSYLDLSKLGIPQQKIDPTFIASIFVGLSSTFGANITQKGDKPAAKNGNDPKEELKELIGNTQLIRIETPVKLVPVEPKVDKLTNKTADPQTSRLTE
tara:strand:- start:2013 stop:2459 length:447 start_codon:yes stop_codon:yes gene_type:complete